MSFVGQANRFGDSWVRPHDLQVTLSPNGTTREAMVERVTHLGFEVRVELARDDGELFAVQLTRDEAERLELERGQIVYVRPTRETTFRNAAWTSVPARVQCGAQASGSAASARTRLRQLAGSEVGERHLLEHRPEARAHRDPDVAQALGAARCTRPARSARRGRSRAARRRRESRRRG